LWDDLTPYRDRIRRHPQISDVSISRRMPGTLVVTVKENLPVALIQTPAGLLPYDSLGKQLPIDPAGPASTELLRLPILFFSSRRRDSRGRADVFARIDRCGARVGTIPLTPRGATAGVVAPSDNKHCSCAFQ
jgi:hypothetical protein